MDIIFLDANVIFSAAYQKECGILRLWQLPKTQLTTSLYAAEEAQRNLKLQEQKERLISLLSKMQVVNVEQSNIALPEYVNLPAKDHPILSAAIAVGAKYLLTGDYKDFGAYFGQTIVGITILPPAQYFNQFAPPG